LSGKLGDPTVWIRLPSVLAGAAAVPTLYLLGTKLDRRPAGLIAAALIAVLPFAVFYGSEARAYGLLLFLLPLSTLALLRALEEGRPLWWAVYWLVASLAIYTQYIAGLVVALQAVWALIAWREEWRGILAVNAAVLLTLAPWFGRIDNNTDLLEPIRSLHPLTAGHIPTDPLRVAFGNPFVGATEVPGLISLLMVIAAAGIAAVAFIVTRVRRPQAGEQVTAAFQRSRDEIWLLVLLVVGPPVLTLLYSLVGNSIYIARNLISILPYLCVLAAVLIAALPRRAMLAVATLTVLAALLASVRMLVDYARPDLRAAAEMIETHAAPGTQVVEPRFLSTADPLKEDLAIYLDDRYPLSHDLNDLEKVSRGADVWAVVPNPALRGAVDAAAKKAGAKPVDAHTIQGLADVYVADYRRTGGPPAGSQSVPAGVFVGKVHGTSADIALVTDGERLTGAYLCNSKGVSPWFRPALLPDGRADLVTRGGDALGNVSFAGKRATGGVAVGVKSGSFSAQLAKGKAGLYRTTSGKAGKPGFRETGWIMLPDGSKCGSTDVNAPSGYKSVPAPASPKGKVSDFVNPYGL
jgi:hypothetical protein